MRRRPKKTKNYAFIDSQNLNLGVGTNISIKGHRVYYGWQLDFHKFFKYLRETYAVDKAFLFIGYTQEQEALYEELHSFGYNVVLKPTTSHKNEEGETVVKGNVDTELVLFAAAREYANYDKAIIITGDGDFLSLCEYLDERKKLGHVLIPNKIRYSQLLSKYADRIDFVSEKRKTLQKADQAKQSPEPAPENPTLISPPQVAPKESSSIASKKPFHRLRKPRK